MVIVGFRVALYALVLLLLAVASLGWWWGSWAHRREPGFSSGVWEHAPIGFMLLSEGKTYRWANDAARRLLGLENASGSLPDIEWVHTLLADRARARSTEGRRGLYRQMEIDDDRVVRWWISTTPKGDVVLLWDVTAYHKTSEAAHVLLSTLAHELRNPLGVIRTHTEILSLPDVPLGVRQQSLGILRDEAARLSRLIDQMLELGRLDATPELDLRPTDILPLVEQAVALFRPQMDEKGLILQLVAESALPSVLADPDRLYQVFLNVLDNALTYCHPGDTVTITLEDRDDGVYCEVRDTGPGISAKHLPHVTRRFYRGDRGQHEGSGLGLAIVEEILKRHGTTLHVESHTEGPKRGTRISFTLPKAT